MNHDEQQGMGMGKGKVKGQGKDEDEVGGEFVASTADVLFDHERLHVYRLARQLFVLTRSFARTKMPRDLRSQLDRAVGSILSNIGEGAGKTAQADKKRFYEIAKGSATESVTQLDMLHIIGLISDEELRGARHLLVQIVRMLHALCAPPSER